MVASRLSSGRARLRNYRNASAERQNLDLPTNAQRLWAAEPRVAQPTARHAKNGRTPWDLARSFPLQKVQGRTGASPYQRSVESLPIILSPPATLRVALRAGPTGPKTDLSPRRPRAGLRLYTRNCRSFCPSRTRCFGHRCLQIPSGIRQ
jgi:hypothetical protein